MNKPLTPCVLTPYFTNPGGYGLRSYKGKRQLAHRVAYCEHNNVPIESILGKVVLHACDNPPCIRGDHLTLGTQADNIRDMYDKGRGLGGKPRGLTDEQVRYVRKAHAEGATYHALGKYLGINKASIFHIIKGNTYRHVTN